MLLLYVSFDKNSALSEMKKNNPGMIVDEYVKQPLVSPLGITGAEGAAGHCAPTLLSFF